MDREAHRPIFIVGCQRSGTTLLRLILDSHPNISCGPETRFLADLEKVTGEGWPRMSLYGLPRSYWIEKFAVLFHDFKMDYAERCGKTRWADKTPLYALHLPFIDELFPHSQIVHVVRDGRDVVASHRSRWGYLSALNATAKWARYIRLARAFGTSLPADRYLEVRYEDVVNNTEPAMRKVLDFLAEPWHDDVLHHDEKPHDVMERYRDFTRERRVEHGEAAAVYRASVGAHRQENDGLLRVVIRWRSGRMLKELGYR
jgi:hypothetical protein